MISIIGAGPVGSYLAYLLAKKGWKVNVYEEHENIGLPVQCTGIVTSSIEKLIPIRKKFLVNKLKRVKVFSNNEKLDIDLPMNNLVICRKEFDRYLAEKAMDAGAKYFLGWKFLDFDGKNIKFNKCVKKTDVLIGADGVHSKVSKLLGNKTKLITGVQARVNTKVDKDCFETYFDNDFFGWIVPESSSVARVGVISTKNPEIKFRKFLIDKVGKCKIREYQSGMIPVYDKKLKIKKGNVYLLGDAAGHVKATTFGGIVQGMESAKILANCLYYKKNYKFNLRKLNKELNYSLLLRKKLNKFKSKDYDYLLKLVNQEKIKKVLSKFDRDKPSKIMFKLALKEPRFLRFLF